MKIPAFNKSISISAIIKVVLLIVVAYEIYLAYVFLYPNLFVSEDVVITDEVVRVDLPAYNNTIELLDDLEAYVPPPVSNADSPF